MTSYVFTVVVKPDEDRWHTYCPALVDRGAATWGATREEALANIEDVVKMAVASMMEYGEAIEPAVTVEVSREPRVAGTA
jgi:predicted RNase H-like HicB family nuclease